MSMQPEEPMPTEVDLEQPDSEGYETWPCPAPGATSSAPPAASDDLVRIEKLPLPPIGLTEEGGLDEFD